MEADAPQQSTLTRRAELAVAAVGYALLAVATFPGLAAWRGTAAYHDLSTHHVPWRAWTASRWLGGDLPLWNDLAANGFPMLAEPQVGALYPPNLLFGLVDPWVALNLSILAHAWLAGFAAYLFGRSLGLRRAGAALTGVVYGASGFLVTHVVYLPMLHSAAWIPLLLLNVDRFLRDGRPRAALFASGSAAMMVLAGHPQIAVLGALLGGTYFLSRVATGYPDGPPRHQRLARGWRLGLALGFAVLLALPQLVATVELAGESERAGGVEGEFAAQGALPIQEVIHAVLPRTFGYERPSDLPLAHHHHGELYWGNGESFWEDAFFVGVPGMLLALLALASGARGVRFFAVWLVLAPLLMVGPATPLFLLWHKLPGADLLRFPARFALLFTFSVAVLAGYGLDAWIAQAREASRRYLWLTRGLLIALALAWAASAVLHASVVRKHDDVVNALEGYYERKLVVWQELSANPPPGVDPLAIPPPPEGGAAPITVATLYDGDDYYSHKVQRIVAGLREVTSPVGVRVLLPLGMAVAVLVLIPLAVTRPVFRWCVVALAAVDLLAFVSGFVPPVPWDEARHEPACARIVHDDVAALGLSAARVAVVDRLTPLALDAEIVGASDNLLEGLREVSIPSPLRVQSQYQLVGLAGLGLEPLLPPARLERVEQRIDVVRALGVTHLQSMHELPPPYELVSDGPVRVYRVPDPWPRASLHATLPPPPAGASLARPAARVEVVEDTPGRIVLDTSAVGAGFVVVTESAYPGWAAEVDGESAELLTAAGGLLAVDVGAGAREVMLAYRPRGLLGALIAFPLMWVLWGVWCFMAGGLGTSRRRRVG